MLPYVLAHHLGGVAAPRSELLSAALTVAVPMHSLLLVRVTLLLEPPPPSSSSVSRAAAAADDDDDDDDERDDTSPQRLALLVDARRDARALRDAVLTACAEAARCDAHELLLFAGRGDAAGGEDDDSASTTAEDTDSTLRAGPAVAAAREYTAARRALPLAVDDAPAGNTIVGELRLRGGVLRHVPHTSTYCRETCDAWMAARCHAHVPPATARAALDGWRRVGEVARASVCARSEHCAAFVDGLQRLHDLALQAGAPCLLRTAVHRARGGRLDVCVRHRGGFGGAAVAPAAPTPAPRLPYAWWRLRAFAACHGAAPASLAAASPPSLALAADATVAELCVCTLLAAALPPALCDALAAAAGPCYAPCVRYLLARERPERLRERMMRHTRQLVRASSGDAVLVAYVCGAPSTQHAVQRALACAVPQVDYTCACAERLGAYALACLAVHRVLLAPHSAPPPPLPPPPPHVATVAAAAAAAWSAAPRAVNTWQCYTDFDKLPDLSQLRP